VAYTDGNGGASTAVGRIEKIYEHRLHESPGSPTMTVLQIQWFTTLDPVGALCGHAALLRLDREHIWNTKHCWVVVTDVMPHNVVFWKRDARDPDCDEYVVIKRSLNRDYNTR
jgi:hypothetical protein